MVQAHKSWVAHVLSQIGNQPGKVSTPMDAVKISTRWGGGGQVLFTNWPQVRPHIPAAPAPTQTSRRFPRAPSRTQTSQRKPNSNHCPRSRPSFGGDHRPTQSHRFCSLCNQNPAGGADAPLPCGHGQTHHRRVHPSATQGCAGKHSLLRDS